MEQLNTLQNNFLASWEKTKSLEAGKVHRYEINDNNGKREGFFLGSSDIKTIEAYINKQHDAFPAEKIQEQLSKIRLADAEKYLEETSSHNSDASYYYDETHTALKIAAGLITLEAALKENK